MNGQILINKRVFRFFKFILLSPQLEKVSLFSYLLLFFLILLFFVTDNFNHLNYPSSEKNGILKIQSYFQNNISLSRFMDFLSSDFQSNYLNPSNSMVKLMGGVRVTQYRMIKSSDCYDPFSQTRFSVDCNGFFEMDWSSSLRNSIDLPDTLQMCIETKCQEFITRYLDFATRETYWKTYPNWALFVTLPLASFEESVQKLADNNWFSSNETVTILLEFNTLDLRFFNIMHSQIYLEMPDVTNSKLTIRFNNIMMRTGQDFLYDVLSPFYLLVLVLLTIKGAFEMSYFMNKMTGICNLITYIINLTLAICLFFENAQYHSIFSSDLDENYPNFLQVKGFLPLNTIFFYRYIESILLILCLIPFPFKIFEFIIWFNFFGFMLRYINSMYRTFIGLSIYLVSILIISIGWTLGFYMIFRDYEPDFKTFFIAFFSFFFSKSSFEASTKEMEFFSIDILSSTMKVLRFMVFVYFLAVIVYCVYKATSFDYYQFYANQDETINENLTNVSSKIDKFVKKYLPNLQQDNLNKNLQIIVWLSSGVFSLKIENELMEICQNEDVKLLIFQEVKEVIQFLNYLFKLKPNLAFKSDNFFRIVIEFPLDQIEKNPKSMVLSWLQDYGSRVPILIFVNEIENLNGVLQRMYKYVHLSRSIEDVKEFMGFKKIAEIKFNQEREKKVNTVSEMDSSVFSHSFEMENSGFTVFDRGEK